MNVLKFRGASGPIVLWVLCFSVNDCGDKAALVDRSHLRQFFDWLLEKHRAAAGTLLPQAHAQSFVTTRRHSQGCWMA
jgi:hypothetical protein